jgi:hypothetical protein
VESWARAAVLGTIVLGWSSFAASQSMGKARIAVTRAENALLCPDGGALIERLRSVRAKADAELPEVFLDVRMQRDEEGFSAEVRASGARAGIRTLRAAGPGCEALADAVAVSIAVLLDEEERAVTTAPPALPVSVSEPPRPREHRSRGDAWLGGGAAMGMPHELGGIATGGVAIEIADRTVIGAEGVWAPSRTIPFAGESVDVSLALGLLKGCRFSMGFVRESPLALCAAAGAGRLHGAGRGFSPDRTANRALFLAGPTVLVRGPVAGPLGLTFEVSALFPLRRETFSVDGSGTAYETPTVMVGAVLGATVSIW